MALFPIYGVFEGDFVPHLVAIDTENTMSQVAEAVAVHSVGRRVAVNPSGLYEAIVAGEAVSLERTFGEILAEKGLAPLDFVTVRYANRLC
jgi:toluene monooxygenase system protein B